MKPHYRPTTITVPAGIYCPWDSFKGFTRMIIAGTNARLIINRSGQMWIAYL